MRMNQMHPQANFATTKSAECVLFIVQSKLVTYNLTHDDKYAECSVGRRKEKAHCENYYNLHRHKRESNDVKLNWRKRIE